MAAAKIDARVRELRDEVQRLIDRERLDKAIALLDQLAELEPGEARWPQKQGDLARRLGRKPAAVAAYERAALRYAAQGFVARAVAMAKTIESLDPSRTDVLAKVDPGAAQKVHREQRPGSVSAQAAARGQAAGLIAAAPPLRAAIDAGADETRFGDAPEASVFELDLDELVPVAAPATPPSPAAGRMSFPEITVEAPTSDARDDEPPSEVAFFLPEDEEPDGEARSTPGATADPRDGDDALRLSLFDEVPPEVDRLAALPGFPLFSELPRERLHRIADAAALIEAEAGTTLVQRGDPADSLFAIVSGAVRVKILGLASDVLLGEGEVFGESCLLAHATRSAEVVVERRTTLLRIPKAALDEAVVGAPALFDVLFELLARRLIANLLSTSALFAAFDPETRRDIARLFEVRSAPRGSLLMERGKRADALYVVLGGRVALELEDGSTREAAGGTILGQGSLVARAPSSISARALEDALVLRLPSSKLGSFAALYPPAMAHLAELAAS